MNTKKISLILTGIMVASMAITGCGNSNTTSDKGSDSKDINGVYQIKNEANNETTVIELTYENGEPVSLSIDAETADGSKRELSETGKYVMRADEEHHWHEQVDMLGDFLKDNKFDTSKVAVNEETSKTDAVTGVTIAVGEYVNLVDELMEQVEAGTATEVK